MKPKPNRAPKLSGQKRGARGCKTLRKTAACRLSSLAQCPVLACTIGVLTIFNEIKISAAVMHTSPILARMARDHTGRPPPRAGLGEGERAGLGKKDAAFREAMFMGKVVRMLV